MPTEEDIVNQRKLLQAHRETLTVYIHQRARIGDLSVSPAVIHGISTARAEIQRIKDILRSWNQDVEDLPDDGEAETHLDNKSVGVGTPFKQSARRVREFRLFGISMWSVHEYEEKRQYRVFGVLLGVLTKWFFWIGIVLALIGGSIYFALSEFVVPIEREDRSPPSCPEEPVCEIFSQAGDGEDWSWSIAPGSLTTQFVEDGDCHLSGRYGLRLVYSFTDAGNGGWGVHWANSPARHFDASGFTTLTFSVRGTAPNRFQIGLKDTTGFEVNVESNEFGFASDTEWRTLTIPLTQFAQQGSGVNIASIENVHFSFHSGHGAGNICIDEIVFQ
jgi:Complex I intermediate-associated protein 30 (CIA30)